MCWLPCREPDESLKEPMTWPECGPKAAFLSADEQKRKRRPLDPAAAKVEVGEGMMNGLGEG